MKEIVKLEDLTLTYQSTKHETTALKNLNFSIQEEEFISIVGPSGCGKTTILSLISGLIKPTSGKIELLGYSYHTDYMIQKWLEKINKNFPSIELDTHIIMPDHIHLILQIRDPANVTSIPTVIEWFKTMTTNEYIRSVKEGQYPPFQKSVWQRGYYEHIIRNIDDLSEIRNYIVRNPQICYFRHLPKPTQGGFHES